MEMQQPWEQLEKTFKYRNNQQNEFFKIKNTKDKGKVQCSLKEFNIGERIYCEETYIHASLLKNNKCKICSINDIPKNIRRDIEKYRELVLLYKIPQQETRDTVHLQLLQCYIYYCSSISIREWIDELDTTHTIENEKIINKQLKKNIKYPEWFPNKNKLLQIHILGAQRCNVHESDNGLGSSLFMISSLIEHSCEPNCNFINIEDGHYLILQCIKKIHKGDSLSISYIPTLCMNTKYRRYKLYKQYNFSCYCILCSKYIDLYTGFQCPKCAATLYPYCIKYDKGITRYIRNNVTCLKCGYICTSVYNKKVESIENILYRWYWKRFSCKKIVVTQYSLDAAAANNTITTTDNNNSTVSIDNKNSTVSIDNNNSTVNTDNNNSTVSIDNNNSTVSIDNNNSTVNTDNSDNNDRPTIPRLALNIIDINTLQRIKKRKRGTGILDPYNSAVIQNLLYLCYYSIRRTNSNGELVYAIPCKKKYTNKKDISNNKVYKIYCHTVNTIKLWQYTLKALDHYKSTYVSYEKLCIIDHMAQICYTVNQIELALKYWKRCINLSKILCGDTSDITNHYKMLFKYPPKSLAELVERCT